MSEPMVTYFADEYTLARLKELEGENERLRERIEQLEYMEARSAAEAKAERERAEFWKGETYRRVDLLRKMPRRVLPGTDWSFCAGCEQATCVADCLMTMPEEPKPCKN